MDKVMEVKLELLKELTEFLEKNKIKYYLDGDLLLNIYNDIKVENNVNFEIAVCEDDVKNIFNLTNDNRNIKKIKDRNNSYYRYFNTKTLYFDSVLYNEKQGIYVDIKLSKKDYHNYEKVKVNDILVQIPKNLDEVLENNKGLGYKYLEEQKYDIPGNVIASPIIPYEEYFNTLKDNKYKINKNYVKKANNKSKKEIEIRKTTEGFKTLVKRTHTRFRLLEKYEDKKENIIRLAKEKNYKQLEIELKDYLIEIKNYYDLGLALSFDKDIFYITIDFLKHDHQEKLAKWLEENVPESHLKNIDFSYKKVKKGNNTELRYLQESFVALLKQFDELCKKNNITYYLDSGSVLGAVRNEGFLPWDDDVDVLVDYNNWDKLRKVLKDNPIKDTQFECIEYNKNHTLYTGKIFNKKSTKVYYSYSLLDSTYGFHLDLIIMDENVDNKILNKIHMALFGLYGQMLNPNEPKYNRNICFYVRICNVLFKVFGREKVLKLMRKILFNNKNKSSKYYMYRWQQPKKLKKDIFKEQLYVPFEDAILPIPSGYKEYLETQYGESWFMIPLPEDRMPSKRVFNLYVPYYMYQDDYMSFINKKETNKAYRKLRMIRMKKSTYNKKYGQVKRTLKFYRDKLEFTKKYDLNIVSNYFDKNEFGKLRDYLKDFYYKQTRNGYIKDNLIICTDSNFLYQIIYTLIMCGEYYDARKLLKCKVVSDILEDKTKVLNKLIDNAKYISDKGKEEVKELFHKYPYCINFYLEYYKQINDKKEKEQEVNKFNEIYKDFGETKYIYGLYLLENGNKEDAKKALTETLSSTRNGLILKEVRKILNNL